MSPKVFLGLLVALFIAAAILLLGDDIFSSVFDKDLQDQAAENLGITKAGKARPGD